MTIIKLKDGLGNQLFQYAFGRVVSIKRNEELLLDTGMLVARGDVQRQYNLDNFNIKSSVTTSLQVKKFKYPLGVVSKLYYIFRYKILRIFNIGWNSKILDSKKKYFDGYWQSYRYADMIRKELLEELQLKENIENKYREVLEKINSINSVSLHVRRGDYVDNLKTRKIHNICDLEYYRKAIEIVVDKIDSPVFFIFSDDIEWVKENLKSDHPLIFVSKPGIKDYEELIIMSKCKHNIIANSSFSWWGAWLNVNREKIVIAPLKWNNHYQKEYKYLLPDKWIRI